MQRRPATSNYPLSNPSTPSVPGATQRSTSNRRAPHKKRKLNPILVLIGVALVIMCMSWLFFPDEVNQVEKEAEHVGQKIAEQAVLAEHQMQHWMEQNGGSTRSDRSASDAASAAMLTQSSKWVDGEKKLKKKLMELYEKQQNGELLGVPVLTRWLGDDFPAWVTPDMDEEKWRKDVAAKYEQMREEEEQWKRDMQRIIDQRERDLGITTAR